MLAWHDADGLTCNRNSGDMQALKQNSSVIGAMTKLRKDCKAGAGSGWVAPGNTACSRGPAKRVAVSRVGLTTARSNPLVVIPSKGRSRLTGHPLLATCRAVSALIPSSSSAKAQDHTRQSNQRVKGKQSQILLNVRHMHSK